MKSKLSAAWIGLMEKGSILIKEKHKHFPKHQTGCLKCFGAQVLDVSEG